MLDLQQSPSERFKLWPFQETFPSCWRWCIACDTTQQCKVILLMSQCRTSESFLKDEIHKHKSEFVNASETWISISYSISIFVLIVNLYKYATHKPEGKWSIEWGTPNCSNHRLSSPEYMSYRCQNQDFRYYLCSVLIFILLDIFLVFHLSALSVRSSLWLRNKALLDRE